MKLKLYQRKKLIIEKLLKKRLLLKEKNKLR